LIPILNFVDNFRRISIKIEIKINIKGIIPFVPKIEFSKLEEDGVLIGAAVKIFEPLKRRGLVIVKQ
jgi:hypothetical protein